MKFSQFSQHLSHLESIASRNEMTTELAKLFQALKRDEVKQAMYLLQGRVVPLYIPLEFNFSTKLLARALEEVCELESDEIKAKLAKLGDIGLVAEDILDGKENSAHEIKEVYAKLMELAQIEGKGAQELKSKIFQELVVNLDKVSIRYVSRMITGKMRLGLSDKTVLDGLSWALTGDKSLRTQIERAYGVRSDLGLIAEVALNEGMEELEKLELKAGTPVASKLVEREKSAESTFERMGKSVVQAKYDGLRTQIHFKRDGFDGVEKKGVHEYMLDLGGEKKETARIFSRNMEPLTDMFPDIVEAVAKLKVDSIVLDGEAIGYNPKTGEFMAFQDTIQRKRKYGVAESQASIPIKVFVFDLLALNGEDLTKQPLEERLEKLEEILKETELQQVLVFSKSEVVETKERLNDIFRDYLARGLEGVIVKALESTYDPGTRNYDWIKLKANTYEDMVDSVDCVVLGYYYGSGARAKFGAGAFLVGVYDEVNETFCSIAKVGSGIKDEEWSSFVGDVEALKVNDLPKNVRINKELMPNVICRPEIVVVVDADEITKSKGHTAGQDKEGRGYSLRFPRLKQWKRLDKKPEQITTVAEIERMFALSKNGVK